MANQARIQTECFRLPATLFLAASRRCETDHAKIFEETVRFLPVERPSIKVSTTKRNMFFDIILTPIHGPGNNGSCTMEEYTKTIVMDKGKDLPGPKQQNGTAVNNRTPESKDNAPPSDDDKFIRTYSYLT